MSYEPQCGRARAPYRSANPIRLAACFATGCVIERIKHTGAAESFGFGLAYFVTLWAFFAIADRYTSLLRADLRGPSTAREP